MVLPEAGPAPSSNVLETEQEVEPGPPAWQLAFKFGDQIKKENTAPITNLFFSFCFDLS